MTGSSQIGKVGDATRSKRMSTIQVWEQAQWLDLGGISACVAHCWPHLHNPNFPLTAKENKDFNFELRAQGLLFIGTKYCKTQSVEELLN